MSRVGALLRTLLGLFLLLALIVALGWLIYTTVTEAPAVVAAVITGFLAIIGLGVQRYLEQQREDERIRRDRMAPIYEKLIAQIHLASSGDVEEMEDFFAELTQRLQLWGAPPVIAAFNAWRRSLPDRPTEGRSQSMHSLPTRTFCSPPGRTSVSTTTASSGPISCGSSSMTSTTTSPTLALPDPPLSTTASRTGPSTADQPSSQARSASC